MDCLLFECFHHFFGKEYTCSDSPVCVISSFGIASLSVGQELADCGTRLSRVGLSGCLTQRAEVWSGIFLGFFVTPSIKFWNMQSLTNSSIFLDLTTAGSAFTVPLSRSLL